MDEIVFLFFFFFNSTMYTYSAVVVPMLDSMSIYKIWVQFKPLMEILCSTLFATLFEGCGLVNSPFSSNSSEEYQSLCFPVVGLKGMDVSFCTH